MSYIKSINIQGYTEVKTIADEYLWNLCKGNFIVFTDASKDEKDEVGDDLVIPYWNTVKEFKIPKMTLLYALENKS